MELSEKPVNLNLQILYQSDYVRVERDDQDIIHYTWLPETEDMNEQEYLSELRGFIKTLHEYPYKGILIDMHERKFVVNPQLQEWMGKEILPQMFASGIKKMAICMPESLIPSLSVEQTIDEISEKEKKIKSMIGHFIRRDEAHEWLCM